MIANRNSAEPGGSWSQDRPLTTGERSRGRGGELRQTVSAARRELAAKISPVKTKAARGENQRAQAAPSMGPTVRPAEVTELSIPYTQPSSPR
jgi:hypothetical protein